MAGSHAEWEKKKKLTAVKAQKTNKNIRKVEKWEADPSAVPSVSFFATPLHSERNRVQKVVRMKSSILRMYFKENRRHCQQILILLL